MNKRKSGYEDFGRVLEGSWKSKGIKRGKTKTENFPETEIENFSKTKIENFSEMKIENFSEPKTEKFSDYDQVEKITKDNIWPKSELGNGDLFMQFCINQLRKAVLKKCPDPSIDKIREFFDCLVDLKHQALACKTEDEIIDLITRCNKGEFSVIYRGINTDRLTRERMEDSHFGIPYKDIPDYEANRNVKRIRFNNENYRSSGQRFTYIDNGQAVVYKNSSINDLDEEKTKSLDGNTALVIENEIVKFQATKDDLINAREEYAETYRKANKSKRGGSKPKKILTGHLKALDRVGIDFIGDNQIETDTIQDVFGFYAGQFGKWVNYYERYDLTKYIYNALADLCYALNMNPTSLSLNGNLAIAFGSRGSGHRAAHYETEEKILHLTKIHGAGYLAQEWFHALDHYLANIHDLYNTFYSEQKGEYEALNELMEYLTFGAIEYKNNSRLLDELEERKISHWDTPTSMLYRAFTSYIVDILSQNGYRDDYLAYEYDPPKDSTGREISFYPLGHERERINKLFDKFFKELKDDSVLVDLDIEKLKIKPG